MIRQLISNLKKYVFAFFLCVFIILLSIINVDRIASLITWERSETITLITSSILPFIFSVIFALSGFAIKSFIEDRDKKERYVNNINNTIRTYNLVMIKSIRRFNSLMRLYDKLLKDNNRFEKNSQLKQIVEVWKKNTRETIQFSNNVDFIKLINNHIFNLVMKEHEDRSIFTYFGNMGIIPEEIEKYNNDDSIFLFKIRDFLLLSDEEINILTIYCENFLVNKLFERTINEYNFNINKYNSINQCAQTKGDILIDSITGVIFSYYYLLEFVILELFMLHNFISILVNKFEQYHNDKKNEYKVIDEMVKPHLLFDDRIIMEYINKEKVYEHYKINIKNKDKKMM